MGAAASTRRSHQLNTPELQRRDQNNDAPPPEPNDLPSPDTHLSVANVTTVAADSRVPLNNSQSAVRLLNPIVGSSDSPVLNTQVPINHTAIHGSYDETTTTTTTTTSSSNSAVSGLTCSVRVFHSPPFRQKYSSFTITPPGACIQGIASTLSGTDIGQEYANNMRAEVRYLLSYISNRRQICPCKRSCVLLFLLCHFHN